jgi:hypothetical protein
MLLGVEMLCEIIFCILGVEKLDFYAVAKVMYEVGE